MFDASKLLQRLLQNRATRVVAGGVAGSMLLSRGGRKVAGGALKLGGVAAIGALAYRAFRNNESTLNELRSAAVKPELEDEIVAPPPESGFLPPPEDVAANQELGLVLVRAMIAAAKADGRLDEKEIAAILAGLDTHELSSEERAEVMAELSQPVDIEQLVAAARTPRIAAEIYIAARSAIDPDTDAEKEWLCTFAARLGLEVTLVQRLEEALAG